MLVLFVIHHIGIAIIFKYGRKTTSEKKEILYEVKVTPDDYSTELETIGKLSILCEQVIQFVINGKRPSQPFAGINTAKKLQEKLNKIHLYPVKNISANYIRGKERIIQSENSDFESLG